MDIDEIIALSLVALYFFIMVLQEIIKDKDRNENRIKPDSIYEIRKMQGYGICYYGNDEKKEYISNTRFIDLQIAFKNHIDKVV